MAVENKAEEMQVDANQTQQVKLNFRVPTRLPSVIAQHLSVQIIEDGVLLSFYEVIPPVIKGDSITEEEIKKLRDVGVTAECVSKVFVPASRYEEFVEAMKKVLLKDTEKESE